MVALANYAHEEFDTAVLESPFFEDGESVHCFKFYYNFQVSYFLARRCIHIISNVWVFLNYLPTDI